MQINFIGGISKNRSPSIDGQECMNWYLEEYANFGMGQYYKTKQDAKSTKSLLPCPGRKQFITITGKSVRGMYTTSTNRAFAVIDNKLYEFISRNVYTLRGTLKTNSGIVNFADNGDGGGRGYGMILVDGQYGYMYNLAMNVFTQITDENFQACSHVVFIDGYFIVNKINTTQCWFSNLYNGLDWGECVAGSTSTSTQNISTGVVNFTIQTGLTALDQTKVYIYNDFGWMFGDFISYDINTGIVSVNVTSTSGAGNYSTWAFSFYGGSSMFISAEGSPDHIEAIETIGNELWIIGSQTSEVFYDNGASIGDFQRIHGAFMNIGTSAKYSVKNNGSTLFWLGSNAQGRGQVWMAKGYQPTKISTNSIDYMIEVIPKIDDAVGFCYTQNGHEFYMLSFPSGDITLCFDIATQEWHQRSYYNAVKGKHERHKVQVGCYFNGKNYVGDYDSGNICEFDLETYTDNGDIIRRVRTGPHIHSDRKRLFFKEFEIDIERGIGLDGITQGDSPKGFLTWSDDGGKSWSNEYWGSFGKIGEYVVRMHWHRLGMSRDRMFRFVVSDPVKCVLIDARGDISARERG